MTGLDFIGLEPTSDPTVWELPISRGVTGLMGQLFGGCLVGAVAGMLEQHTGRPAVWVTSQFAAAVVEGDVVTLRAEVAAEGRTVSQVRVRGTTDGAEHSTSLAAFGGRTFDKESPARPIPDVDGPDRCDSVELERDGGRLVDRIDVRSVEGPAEALRPRSRMWFRFPDGSSGDPLAVAIAADFFPPALSAAVGRRVFGASLDNTVRFIDRAECEWILVEMNVESVRNGIAHGTNHVWSDDGRLLAVAGQTCTVSAIDP